MKTGNPQAQGGMRWPLACDPLKPTSDELKMVLISDREPWARWGSVPLLSRELNRLAGHFEAGQGSHQRKEAQALLSTSRVKVATLR